MNDVDARKERLEEVTIESSGGGYTSNEEQENWWWFNIDVMSELFSVEFRACTVKS